MYASDLIQELTELIEKYGDLDVYVPVAAGDGCCDPGGDPEELEAVYWRPGLSTIKPYYEVSSF